MEKEIHVPKGKRGNADGFAGASHKGPEKLKKKAVTGVRGIGWEIRLKRAKEENLRTRRHQNLIYKQGETLLVGKRGKRGSCGCAKKG